jgi:hypothetical protein
MKLTSERITCLARNRVIVNRFIDALTIEDALTYIVHLVGRSVTGTTAHRSPCNIRYDPHRGLPRRRYLFSCWRQF